METLLLVVMLAINVGISFWNARVAGQVWHETKVMGGFMRLVVWSAAIQSAIGFSMLFGLVFGGIIYGLGYLPVNAAKAATALWYLAIIVPALGTGFIIMIHSWIVAYRERNLLSMGTAAWNTFSMAHNVYSASSGIGNAFSVVGEFFSGDNDDVSSSLVVLVVLLVVGSLASGAFLTAAIINHYKGTLPLPERDAVTA